LLACSLQSWPLCKWYGGRFVVVIVAAVVVVVVVVVVFLPSPTHAAKRSPAPNPARSPARPFFGQKTATEAQRASVARTTFAAFLTNLSAIFLRQMPTFSTETTAAPTTACVVASTTSQHSNLLQLALPGQPTTAVDSAGKDFEKIFEDVMSQPIRDAAEQQNGLIDRAISLLGLASQTPPPATILSVYTAGVLCSLLSPSTILVLLVAAIFFPPSLYPPRLLTFNAAPSPLSLPPPPTGG
jgi:hypothetical protein